MRTDSQERYFWFTALWPLWPFQLVQNEAASSRGPVANDIQDKIRFTGSNDSCLPIFPEYFQNNRGFVNFRRFVTLLPEYPFEDGTYKSCRFVDSVRIDSFQEIFRELDGRFRRPPGEYCPIVENCDQCIKSLFPMIPQRLNARGLLVSEFLMSLRTGRLHDFKYHPKENIYTKNVTLPLHLNNRNMLWVAGEDIFQANILWWGELGEEILDEGGLTAPKGNKATLVLGPISFYYDNIPDLVYAFLIDPKSSQYAPDAARHLFGLTYAMKDARKTWLFDWVARLVDTIMKMEEPEDFEFLRDYDKLRKEYEESIELFKKYPDTAIKKLRILYAREALEWMARLFAFFETSPENEGVRHKQNATFLDFDVDNSIEIAEVLKDIDMKQDKVDAWRPFLTNQDPQGRGFQRSMARLLFIRKFLVQARDTINSALDVKGAVNIRGRKSVRLIADLVRHVHLNPLTGKVLLLGAPGGGKGLTAEKYHELAIEEIRNSKFLRKKTVEEIWKRLCNILMLPKAREIMDDEDDTEESSKRLLNFVKAQLQGTKWWYWELPNSKADDGSQLWPCRDNALCTMASIEDNQYKLKPCESCPLKDYFSGSMREKLPDIAAQSAAESSLQFMTHYLARLLYAVYGIENSSGVGPKPRPKPKRNFVQILCGVLAEQGPEFISSMRRLFGTAQDTGMPLPGLFQTASYMGGTVFLDEIADTPVKIQDNLLGPLEEKKVYRLGWESIAEDVGNIRVVAATHKDIRALVKLYTKTVADSPRPQGFRPDLLSRLIIFPPLYPSSVVEYLIYENEQERMMNKMDFVSIMLEILERKERDVEVKRSNTDRMRRFMENLYDKVDGYINRTIDMMDFPESRLPGIKKNLVGNITTRLFVGILDEVVLAEKQAEQRESAQDAFLDARLSDILAINLPKLLNYIVNPDA